jgi:hypothetical protein
VGTISSMPATAVWACALPTIDNAASPSSQSVRSDAPRGTLRPCQSEVTFAPIAVYWSAV